MDTKEAEMLARIDERQKNMLQDLDAMSRQLVTMDTRLRAIEAMALRYKGATIAVLSFGAFIGWLASYWEWFRSIVSK